MSTSLFGFKKASKPLKTLKNRYFINIIHKLFHRIMKIKLNIREHYVNETDIFQARGS